MSNLDDKTFGEVRIGKFQRQLDIDVIRNRNSENVLFSPIFTSNNYGLSKDRWMLTLYPKDLNNERNLILFLTNLSKKTITASVSLSLLNQNNDVIITHFKQNYLFKAFEPPIITVQILKISKCGPNHSFNTERIKQSFITDPKNTILKDNKITILCKISIQEINMEKETPIGEILYNSKEFDHLERLFISKEFSDITIIAEGKSLNVHKCILITRSTVFEAMFKSDMKEKAQNIVNIDDIKFNVLQELFRFIYCKKVNQMQEIVCELLIAAEKYCVEDLKLLCEETMYRDLNVENVIKYLDLAILNNAEKLKLKTINWITFNLESLVEKPEFNRFGLEHPKVLLEIMKNYIKT